jgi:hypothetical protein
MCLLLLDTTSAPVSHRHMRSQLADAACRSLSEDVKRIAPEQRLAAFLSHCQFIAQLANSKVRPAPASNSSIAECALAHPAQSALLMADVAQSLAGRGVRYAVIGAIGALVASVSVL